MFLEHFSGWRGDLTGHHWLKLRRIFHITFDVIHKNISHISTWHMYAHLLALFVAISTKNLALYAWLSRELSMTPSDCFHWSNTFIFFPDI